MHVTDRAVDCVAAVHDRKQIFHGRSYIDYAFHPVITGSASPETLATIQPAIEQGTPSFKVFTTDVTTGQSGIRIDHGSVLAALRIAKDAGGIVMVHAEDDDLLKYNEARLKRDGTNQLANVRCAHTPFGEALAFKQVAALASRAEAAVYFVHATAGESVDVVAAERRRDRPVYAETLHNLLCFSNQDYLKQDGAKYHIGMGLPTPEDRVQLWEGVAAGNIATVATDEYTTPFSVKMGGHDIETVPGGHVGIETRGMILLSEGYQKGRLSLRRFVELFATNPARIFGLYPRKGVIQPGSDADLAIWDLNGRHTIAIERSPSRRRLQPVGRLDRRRLACGDGPARQHHRVRRPAQRRRQLRSVAAAAHRSLGARGPHRCLTLGTDHHPAAGSRVRTSPVSPACPPARSRTCCPAPSVCAPRRARLSSRRWPSWGSVPAASVGHWRGTARPRSG